MEGKKAKISIDNALIFKVKQEDNLIDIEVDQLSSGEKHIVLLAYYLVFVVPIGSLVLIDEPEISLHVTWQQNFIQDILKMGEKSQLQFIIATHSPDIVSDFDDHLYPLKFSSND